jgi:hypothetical protein
MDSESPWDEFGNITFLTQPDMEYPVEVPPASAKRTNPASTISARNLILVDETIPCPLWRKWKDNTSFMATASTRNISFGQQEKMPLVTTTLFSENNTDEPTKLTIFEQAEMLGLRNKAKQSKIGVNGQLKIRKSTGLSQPKKKTDTMAEKKRKAWQRKFTKNKDKMSLALSAKKLKEFLMTPPAKGPTTNHKSTDGKRSKQREDDFVVISTPKDDNFVDLTKNAVRFEATKYFGSWQIEDSSTTGSEGDNSTDTKSHQSESKSETMGTASGLNPEFVRLFKIRQTDEGQEVWADLNMLKDVASSLFREIFANDCK